MLQRAEFFVHPDYHSATRPEAEVGAVVEEYEEALRRRVGNAALPVLIYDPELGEETGDFWDLFSPQLRFPSRPGDGVLARDPEVHARFNSHMKEQGVVGGLVHGSYLEECVTDFKAHLTRDENNTLAALPPVNRYTIGIYTGHASVQYGITLSYTVKESFIPKINTGQDGFAPQDFAPDSKIYFC